MHAIISAGKKPYRIAIYTARTIPAEKLSVAIPNATMTRTMNISELTQPDDIPCKKPAFKNRVRCLFLSN
jgi:hypothetical protein